MENNKTFNVNLAVFASGILAFSGVLIETAMNVTFPVLINYFNVTTSQIQWITTIYLIAISVVVPLSSYLINNYSIRFVYTISVLFFFVGTLICIVPFNFYMLLFGRVFQGVATGIALPLMFNIILTKVESEHRGMMMGVGTLTTSIAPALGPTYGGILVSKLSWQFIYILLVPVIVASFFVGLYAIPKEKVEKTETINLSSLFFLGIMFILFSISLSNIGSIKFVILLLLSGLSGYLFYRLNQKKRLLDLTLFKNNGFSSFLFSFLVFQAILLGISFIIPNYIQIVIGGSSEIAGLAMGPGALIGALFAPISGKILDKFGQMKPIIVGLAISLIGLIILYLLISKNTIGMIIVSHVILMIGVGFAYSNSMTVGLSNISREEQADGNSIFITLQQFTGGIATAIVANIIGFYQGSHFDYRQGTMDGSKVSIIVLLTFLCASFIIIVRFFSKKHHKKVE